MTRKRRVVSEQSKLFIGTARELGCDEDPEAFERVFARVVPPKRPPEPPTGEKAGARPKRRRATGKRVTE